ncbi:uncharacterized protein BCR38DRAFT_368265 [Pseudomassariella vexata]|uniref:AAA+ ATPase domain-containing protein n=1 Tax=Pseudomassariella vexata TaxID=1141098 RepID=A0A1Y2E2V3_9PEZI|nr:uncharacterized protein BCR38DRAFT_368265 [Pseudomassariella vexata]ORY65195.1 hypothetical protein BCR38DRAFT_368265 [Pseudomassariella vexata]
MPKMLSVSSPVVYPASSSPPTNKRAKSPQAQKSRARRRAGFIIDDDSDGDESAAPPAPKRRMLSSPTDPAIVEFTEPSSPPAQLDAEPKEPILRSTEETIATAAQPHKRNGEMQESPYDALFNSTGNFASAFRTLTSHVSKGKFSITTCSGKTVDIKQRKANSGPSYERIVAARSKTKEGRAIRSYYGIEMHELVQAAKKEIAQKKPTMVVVPDHPMPSVEQPPGKKPQKALLWTEKYRAKNFMDLCGDDGTNRNVLRWLKRWDPLVFPRSAKSKPFRRPGAKTQVEEEKPLRKILMLTGPPGLGKTTLAHVCAKQAGYDVMEINASDDRSRDVVKNQIRTSLGTESVKTVQHSKPVAGQKPKIARPVCVIVDEVDGVVSGSSGSGEGGFIKALLDLIAIGEKNSAGKAEAVRESRRHKKKGDDFRQMRPLILICNDVYHPSLRPLRQSNMAEIVHVGKPTLDAVVTRLKTVFEKEGIPCEKDAARKLCEAAWGMSSGLEARKGAESNAEGDIRGIMVVGEWVAGRLRSATRNGPLCLTRHWVERNIVHDLAHGGGGARGIGRSNVKDIVGRIFQEGAGFPKSNTIIAPMASANLREQPKAQLGFSEQQKKYAMERLRQMVETSGDVDRVVTDIFSDYPNHEFNDDSFLTKPDQAYEWMHFHDSCSSRLYGSQDWELAPYLSQPVLACHHLFASPIRHSQLMYQKRGGADEEETPPLPFSGPRADFAAREAEKSNRALLQAFHAQLAPTLMRAFRSAEDLSTDFIPYLNRLVSPDVKPVVVGGSGDQRGTASVRRDTERAMVRRAAETLLDVGITLQRGKIEGDMFSRGPTWVYRMEPDIDTLATFETSAAIIHGTHAPTRYAVRQVLDQEVQKTKILRENSARQARFQGGNPLGHDEYILEDKESANKAKSIELPAIPVKRDFFGRVVKVAVRPLQETDANGQIKKPSDAPLGNAETKVWVTFHEGLNNAVRKPLTLDELLRGL